ncbi:hypothetical protein BDV37DRAFT_288577 [Aspergillus pseudonomiae]|uniref:Transcription factor domain-containing protein n=1 Tax=Aspergillus pseudonomiae TaxID=1506151 RepID=A0A5N7CXR5_9EURO|nr:uncharacterized protein BDV37DRAFT_288577 [Aspergillus pseudonomiae]KAE8398373.1 hypothetical protein BDV37DRAFT_288577 [Aspergillus pseudonomiae]
MEPQQSKSSSIGNAAQASGTPGPHMVHSPDDLETISAAYQVLFYVTRSVSFQQLLDSLPPDTPGVLMKPLVCSFLTYFTQPQSDTFLEKVNTRVFETVDRVFHNSKIPPRWLANDLSSRGYTPQCLDEQDCLRWDVIGIIYATVALSLTIRHDLSDFDSDASQPDSWTKETILKDLTHAVNTCIRFQEMTGTKTELYLWLLIQDIILLIRIYGGHNRHVWRRLGDIGNVLFTIGLHKPSLRNQIITQMHIRQQLFLTAYTLDKAITTLMNRPPRISRQYCMDLDNVILSFPAADGLNHYLSTRLSHSLSSPASLVEKASFVMSILREDAQVARSTLHDSPEGSTPGNMTRLLEGMWQSLKVSSGVPPESWQMEQLPHQSYSLLIAYLEYLYTQVYIWQHLLPGQVYTLGEMCRKTLETMICGVKSLGSLEEYRSDFAWRLVLYGLPSAKILASLRFTHSSQTTSRLDSFGQGTVNSELNTFFACILTVIQPKDPHYTDCQQVHQSIKISLAQAADPEVTFSYPPGQSTARPTL